MNRSLCSRVCVCTGTLPVHQPLEGEKLDGYQTWLFWSYSRRHPGTKHGCFGHTQVYQYPIPNLVVLIILGYVPGYQTWLFWPYSGVPGYQTCLLWSYSGVYPGTIPVCFGHTRVCTRVPKPDCFGHTLGYPGTKPVCFGHTRVFTRVSKLVVLVILG